MGIYNFHTWLRQKFPGSYIPIKNNNIYEYIYIDVNFLLHNSVYGCRTENDFIRKLYSQLDIIFTNFIATKKIFFSLDGPCSFAKILLQRKRRTDNSKKINTTGINSLYITPGTETMKRIEVYLKAYVTKLKSKYRFINPETYMSSSNEPDEGEIKISREVIANGSGNLNHRHLIIGNDSDLIVLSMGMKPIYNINILVRGKAQNEVISLKKLLQLHCKYIKRTDTIENLSKSKLRDDFVIVSIMMGNDYLPKIGYIKHDKLWKVYYDLMLSCKNDDDHGNTLMADDCTFNNVIFEKFLYSVYMHLGNSFRKVTIHTYDETKSKSYLEGLLWCLRMYQQGKCPKYDYAYSHNAPHPYELLFHMHSEKEQICMKNSLTVNAIPAEIYSLIVMPKKAAYLIPKKYHKLMNNELKYLYEIEECDKCSDFKLMIKTLNKKIKECDEHDTELEAFKEDYKKNYNTYLIHKKSHGVQFNVNDINKIIELTNKI